MCAIQFNRPVDVSGLNEYLKEALQLPCKIRPSAPSAEVNLLLYMTGFALIILQNRRVKALRQHSRKFSKKLAKCLPHTAVSPGKLNLIN